jgi:hypothetical protein
MTADMHAAKAREWEELGMCDGVYYIQRHVPCGTTVHILMGTAIVCPKCQPEEWAIERAREQGKK